MRPGLVLGSDRPPPVLQVCRQTEGSSFRTRTRTHNTSSSHLTPRDCSRPVPLCAQTTSLMLSSTKGSRCPVCPKRLQACVVSGPELRTCKHHPGFLGRVHAPRQRAHASRLVGLARTGVGGPALTCCAVKLGSSPQVLSQNISR